MEDVRTTVEMPGLPGHVVLKTAQTEFVPEGFVPVARDKSLDRRTTAEDLESFVALSARYQTEGSVVFWTSGGFKASLDDRLRRDFVDMALRYAPEFAAWAALDGKALLPKAFRQFLVLRAVEVRTPGFVDRAKRLDVKLELRFVDETSSDLDMEFAFSSKEGEGSIKLPREVEVEVPIYFASARTHRVIFDIEHKPVQVDDKRAIGFAFALRDKERLIDEALRAEVDALKTALKSAGFDGPVVRGTP